MSPAAAVPALNRRALLAGLALPGLARAQGWQPNRPIRMLCGFPPAGTTDLAARLAAEGLSRRLGVPVAVENRAGASGNIAVEMAARATPDGYTLHATNVGTGAINYTLFGPRMPIRPEDLAEIGLLMRVPNLVLIHPDLPIHSMAALIAHARANPGKLSYGSPGSGGSPHMTMELLKHRGQINLLHVPFRGAGPMLLEAIAGRVELCCDNMPSSIGHVRDGRLRALAVTSAQRHPALPEVPTLAEALPGFEATSWFGIQAPARTPTEVVTRLGAELDALVHEPGYQARLAELGADLPRLTADGGTSPAGYTAFTQSEIRKWAEVVRVSGATVD